MVKVYVEFLFQENVSSDVAEKEVSNRKEVVKLPKGAYGYRFFDREEIEENGDITFGAKKNHSGVTYFGREYTLAQVKRNFPEERFLAAMMESNGYTKAVRVPSGQFYPLANSDIVKRLPGKKKKVTIKKKK